MNQQIVIDMFADLTDETLTILTTPKDELSSAISAISGVDNIAPQHCDIFRAFVLCPIECAKICIIGQEPCSSVGIDGKPIANGLAFSISSGMLTATKAMFSSLIHAKLIAEMPKNCDLTNWARQGVLLLNSSLTAVIGETAAHTTIWTKYTAQLIAELKKRPIIFICFGTHARNLLGEHPHLYWVHPTDKNFIKNDVFIKANIMLRERGEKEINWDIKGSMLTEILKEDYPEENTVANNIGKKWTEDEENQFIEELKSGIGLKEIALIHRRNLGGIKARREKIVYAFHLKGMNVAEIKKLMKLDEQIINHIIENVSSEEQLKESLKESEKIEKDKKITIPKSSKQIYIFTDGAATKNGRENCRASYAYYICEYHPAQFDTTLDVSNIKYANLVPLSNIPGEKYAASNNRGELMAIMTSLKYIADNKTKLANITIVSDSEYSINSITKWAPNWLKDPIKNKLSEKKNMDLIKPAIEYLREIRQLNAVSFRHIKSHTKAPVDKASFEWFLWNGNDTADKLCANLLKG